MTYEEYDITEKVGDYSLMNHIPMSKTLLKRFIRGTVAGAASTGLLVTFSGNNTFTDLKDFLAMLTVALIVGGVTGLLLTVDKYMRM